MIVIVFGVTGAGKTLIGSMLAAELGWKFFDADRYHPAQNIEKMRRGVALTDLDRDPWLESLCDLLKETTLQREDAVLACSALKEGYRQRLAACAEVRWVFLKGEYRLIRQRLRERRGHFMDPGLLKSQFRALEEPRQGTVAVDVRQSPTEIVSLIRSELKL